MDRTDVEILRVLHEADKVNPELLPVIKIHNFGRNMPDQSVISSKLKKLEDDEFVKQESDGYRITSKGNKLFWEGKPKNHILDLLSIDDFSLTDLQNILAISDDSLTVELKLLRDDSMIKSYTTTDDKFYRILEKGEDYIHDRNSGPSSQTIINTQYLNIADTINIQNFETKIDQLISLVDKEDNLSPDQKKTIKEKLSKWKQAGKEAFDFGKPLLQQLTMDGLKELFKSPQI